MLAERAGVSCRWVQRNGMKKNWCRWWKTRAAPTARRAVSGRTRPGAGLRIVRTRVDSKRDGYRHVLDRGKALSETLVDALNELWPDTPLPKESRCPPREWHMYIILHDSYVEEETNRDIMSRLYISEGTFNRTRRRALRAVAKSLAEMESSLTTK